MTPKYTANADNNQVKPHCHLVSLVIYEETVDYKEVKPFVYFYSYILTPQKEGVINHQIQYAER